MTNALPGRPVQNNAQRAVESFHTYLLLILGIAFVGAGIAILGFASGSLAAVGIGAGFLIADGIISLFIAVITKSSILVGIPASLQFGQARTAAKIITVIG